MAPRQLTLSVLVVVVVALSAALFGDVARAADVGAGNEAAAVVVDAFDHDGEAESDQEDVFHDSCGLLPENKRRAQECAEEAGRRIAGGQIQAGRPRVLVQCVLLEESTTSAAQMKSVLSACFTPEELAASDIEDLDTVGDDIVARWLVPFKDESAIRPASAVDAEQPEESYSLAKVDREADGVQGPVVVSTPEIVQASFQTEFPLLDTALATARLLESEDEAYTGDNEVTDEADMLNNPELATEVYTFLYKMGLTPDTPYPVLKSVGLDTFKVFESRQGPKMITDDGAEATAPHSSAQKMIKNEAEPEEEEEEEFYDAETGDAEEQDAAAAAPFRAPKGSTLVSLAETDMLYKLNLMAYKAPGCRVPAQRQVRPGNPRDAKWEPGMWFKPETHDSPLELVGDHTGNTWSKVQGAGLVSKLPFVRASVWADTASPVMYLAFRGAENPIGPIEKMLNDILRAFKTLNPSPMRHVHNTADIIKSSIISAENGLNAILRKGKLVPCGPKALAGAGGADADSGSDSGSDSSSTGSDSDDGFVDVDVSAGHQQRLRTAAAETGPECHSGMVAYWHLIRAGVVGDVRKFLEGKEGPTRVVVTGYSMGGMLAQLAAVDLAQTFGARISVDSQTFGSPMVGNAAFSFKSSALLHGQARIVSEGDPAPTVPTQEFGQYVSVGPCILISFKGVIRNIIAPEGNFNGRLATGMHQNPSGTYMLPLHGWSFLWAHVPMNLSKSIKRFTHSDVDITHLRGGAELVLDCPQCSVRQLLLRNSTPLDEENITVTGEAPKQGWMGWAMSAVGGVYNAGADMANAATDRLLGNVGGWMFPAESFDLIPMS